MRRLETDILYVVSRAALLLALPIFISDVGLYQEYARRFLVEGVLPYAGFDFEYPPLAYPLMLIPALLLKILGTGDTAAYRFFFGLVLLPFDFLLFRGFRVRPPFRGAAFSYVLLTSGLGLLLFDRFDIVVGFFLAWPFLGQPSDARFAWSWGIGGALKLVPILPAPFRALDWSGSFRERLLRAAPLLLSVAAPFLLSCLLAAWLGHGKISFLSRHSNRGVQIESLVGSVVMFLQTFGLLSPVHVDWNFGAQHLAPIAGVVESSRILFLGSLGGSYVLLWWQRARRSTLAATWIVVSAFVTFGYVLSPQFFLWLVPLALCAVREVPAGWRRGSWLLVFGSATLFTGLHFRFYWDYVNLHPGSVLLVLSRNVLLVALWGASWVWMRKPDPSSVS